MKHRRTIKLALAALLIALPLILSGCYVTPDIETGNNPGGALNFPEYNPTTSAPTNAPTNVPTNAPTTSIGSIVTLPTNPGGVSSWTIQPISTIGQVTPVPVTALPYTATPSPTPQGSLKLGSTGEDVRQVQRKLKDLGFYKGSVDGDFGEATEAAVKAFQKQYGLEADGKVGNNTKAKLATARQTAKPTVSPTRRPTATPRATAVPSYSSNTYLRVGSSGSDVRKMQERLISLGYLAGNATGNFDEATRAGVIAFQNRNCSYSDGVAGPDTLKALYSSSVRSTSSASAVIGNTLRNGSEGAAVRVLQSKLKSLGYYTGVVDGDYGTGTVEAVKAFQRAHGMTADGVAGGGTFNKLFGGDAKKASASSSSNQNASATRRPVATRKPTVTPRKTETPIPANIYVKVTPAPAGSDYITLRRGHQGTPVADLQRELKSQGYFSGTVDGFYGEGTENAVKAFQRVNGLKVDGVAGPATQRVLFEGDFPFGA
ncbi:MAG: peptidoglycan-binding protein [Clostridiales bacterium]|nr:peptidoglycan-binding protein [Clostridiales bacterium]